MSLLDKLPTMSDAEVINLLANAQRLSESGDVRQQTAAAELLPRLTEVAAERKAAKLATAQAGRAAARKVRLAAVAVPVEA